MNNGRKHGKATSSVQASRLWVFIGLILFGATEFICAEEPSELTEHYRRMMIYHLRIDGNVPVGAVVFIVDSITQGLCVAAVCERAVNYGIGSDTTLGVMNRLPQYGSLSRAAAVVIAIGVNDLSRRDNDAIVENYRKMIELIGDKAPVIFSAVLPLDERVETVGADRNERIIALNEALERLCREKGCAFVDVRQALVDETENLAPEFHVGDGVHPNAAGCALWIEGLKHAVDKAREGNPCCEVNDLAEMQHP